MNAQNQAIYDSLNDEEKKYIQHIVKRNKYDINGVLEDADWVEFIKKLVKSGQHKKKFILMNNKW